MTTGHEKLQQLSEALGTFEEAVTAREHPGITRNKTALQQEVDKARRSVIDLVVEMVTKAKVEA